MGLRRATLAASAVFAASVLMPAAPASADVTWTKLANGNLAGVSGLAPHQSGWLIARDNKSAGQNRIALLSSSLQVTPLTWPGTQPSDIEALDAVPAQTGQFVAMTSAGRASVLTVSGTSVTVARTVTVPRASSNMEAFAMARLGSTTIAVWGTRGSTSQAAKLFAASFNPSTGGFGSVVSATVRVPYPTTDVRQVSDLKVVAGRILVSSASDPGSNGPFNSALYDVGSVRLSGARPALSMQTPVSIDTFSGHKVEGIACSGTTGLLGTDDEKQGGSVAAASFCTGAGT